MLVIHNTKQLLIARLAAIRKNRDDTIINPTPLHSLTSITMVVPFGKAMREAHFSFATSYVPLNHGSFGTFPNSVRDHRRKIQSETEARPDTFIRFTYPSTHPAVYSVSFPTLPTLLHSPAPQTTQAGSQDLDYLSRSRDPLIAERL